MCELSLPARRGCTGVVRIVAVIPLVTVGVAVVSECSVPIGPIVLIGGGVLNGWRRVWSVFRCHRPQFGVYLIVHLLLCLVIGTPRRVVSGIVYVTALPPGGLVGLGIVFGVFGGVSAVTTSPVALAVLGLRAILAFLVG